jgi:hypothetical protein
MGWLANADIVSRAHHERPQLLMATLDPLLRRSPGRLGRHGPQRCGSVRVGRHLGRHASQGFRVLRVLRS